MKELDNFETLVNHRQREETLVVAEPSKLLMVRKLYRLLKKKTREGKQEKQVKAIKLSESLM